jgi:hypothetical protein
VSTNAARTSEPRRAIALEAAIAAGFVLAALAACLPVLQSGDRWGFWDWDIFLSNFEAARVTVVDYGEAPGWNPYMRGGESLVAHPLLPLATPAFLAMLLLGTIPGVKLWIVVRLFAALYGAYRLGVRLGLSRWGAITVGVFFGFASTYAQRVGHGHWNLAAFVFLPLVLHAGLDAVRPAHWAARAWAAVWLALMFLDGGPYAFALGAIGLGVAALVGVGRRAWRSALAGAATVGALALALSAVKLLPVMATWGGLESPVPYGSGVLLDFYDPDFLPPASEFLYAAWIDREQSNLPGRFATFHINVGAYVGVLGLALAAMGVACGGVARRAVLFGLPVLWLSMGASAPFNLWELLVRLPVVRSMTVPAKFTPGYLLALAVAAGVAVDFVWRHLAQRPRLRWLAPALAIGLALDLVLVSWPLFGHAFPIEPIPVERGAFHQVSTSPYELEYYRRVLLPVGERPFTQEPKHSLSANLPAVRANLGVLDTVSGTRLTTQVHTRPDPGGSLLLVHRSPIPGRPPELLDWSPNTMRIRLDPRRGGRLVVNQNHHRGWEASTASAPLRVVPHGPGLLGVELGPGVGEVQLQFHSTPFAQGAAVSLVAAAVALAAIVRRS